MCVRLPPSSRPASTHSRDPNYHTSSKNEEIDARLIGCGVYGDGEMDQAIEE